MQWGSQYPVDSIMGMKPGMPDPEGSTALQNMVLLSESRLKMDTVMGHLLICIAATPLVAN